MNSKILLTLLLSISLIIPAYSYSDTIFNANEVSIYNNYFYGNDSALNLNQEYNGYKLVTNSGNQNSCYLTKDSGLYAYTGDNSVTCEWEYVLMNNLTTDKNYTYQYNWTYRTGTGSFDQYTSVTISLYGYNGTWNLLNTSSKETPSVLTRNFKGYNYSKLKFLLSTTHSNVANGWFVKLYWFRLYDRDTIGTSYNTQIVKPSMDSTSYIGLSVPIEYKTTKFDASYVPFYYVGAGENFNYTTGVWEMGNILSFSYLDSENYYRYSGGSTFLYDTDYSNFALYVTPVNSWNALISKNMQVLRMTALTNINIDKQSNQITISFKEPSQTSIITGTKTNTYNIILSKSGSVIKNFYFPQTDLVNNVKNYADFSVQRYLSGSDYYIKITYNDNITPPIEDYSLTARYTQNNGSITAYSSMAYNDETFFYKYIALYESNETEPMVRVFNSYDYTDYDYAYAFPTYLDEDVDWFISNTCLDTGVSYVSTPDDFYSGINIPLCKGENEIRIFDNDLSINTYYYITYNYNSTLLNMSLLNFDNSLVCYSNDSFNNCNYNSLSKDFYVKTIHDNYNYTLLSVNMFCDVNGTIESFYSDLLTTNNLYWLPYGIYEDTNELIMIFNKKYNINTLTGLNDWLLSNPDVIKQNEYDFVKILMNSYVKNLPQENKFFYTPSGYNCYLQTSFNDNSLNVSFKGTYSLYNDIKVSNLFFELNSGCILDRYKNNNIFDYANYGSCLFTTFISDNSNTFYYITFLTICIIISKVLLGLFK
jgi:hypothetical protein